MAPPRTFNLDLLKQLITEHPDWTNPRYAEALTADNRANGGRTVVTAHLVSATVTRMRQAWEAEGILVPRKRRRSQLVATLVANTGVEIPDLLQDQIQLRRLRQLDRLADGLPVGGHEGEAERARAFEAKLRAERHVIDLYPDGTCFEREAAPHEIDTRNQLVSIVASYRPSAMAQRHAG